MNIINYYGKKYVYEIHELLQLPRKFSNLLVINNININHTLLSNILKQGIKLNLIKKIEIKSAITNKIKKTYVLTYYGFEIFCMFKFIHDRNIKKTDVKDDE